MRLIDADALQIALIRKYDEVADLLEIVEHQPTAYDVDKVVEEFTDEAYGIESDAYIEMMLYEAIDIVKRGGADDK